MANGKFIMMSMVILLVAMTVFAFVYSDVPTAAVTYGFTAEQIQEARTCQQAGGTPWVVNEGEETLVKCEIIS